MGVTVVRTVVDSIAQRVEAMSPLDIKRRQELALDYYNAAKRAHLGAILERSKQPVLPSLRASINPTTRFNVGFGKVAWPQARAWDIR